MFLKRRRRAQHKGFVFDTQKDERYRNKKMGSQHLESMIRYAFTLSNPAFLLFYPTLLRRSIAASSTGQTEGAAHVNEQCRASITQLLVRHRIAPASPDEVLWLMGRRHSEEKPRTAVGFRNESRAVEKKRSSGPLELKMDSAVTVLRLPCWVGKDWMRSLALLSWVHHFFRWPPVDELSSEANQIGRSFSKRSSGGAEGSDAFQLRNVRRNELYHVPTQDILQTAASIAAARRCGNGDSKRGNPNGAVEEVVNRLLCWAAVSQRRERRKRSLRSACAAFGAWKTVGIEGSHLHFEWSRRHSTKNRISLDSATLPLQASHCIAEIVAGNWAALLQQLSPRLLSSERARNGALWSDATDDRCKKVPAALARRLGVRCPALSNSDRSAVTAPVSLLRNTTQETLPYLFAAIALSGQREVVNRARSQRLFWGELDDKRWNRALALLPPHPKYHSRDDFMLELITTASTHASPSLLALQESTFSLLHPSPFFSPRGRSGLHVEEKGAVDEAAENGRTFFRDTKGTMKQRLNCPYNFAFSRWVEAVATIGPAASLLSAAMSALWHYSSLKPAIVLSPTATQAVLHAFALEYSLAQPQTFLRFFSHFQQASYSTKLCFAAPLECEATPMPKNVPEGDAAVDLEKEATTQNRLQSAARRALGSFFLNEAVDAIATCEVSRTKGAAPHLVGASLRLSSTSLPTQTGAHFVGATTSGFQESKLLVGLFLVDIQKTLSTVHEKHVQAVVSHSSVSDICGVSPRVSREDTAKTKTMTIWCVGFGDLWIIYKPSGVPVGPTTTLPLSVASAISHTGSACRIVNGGSAWMNNGDGGVCLFAPLGLLNRIDVGTSGLLLSARKESALRRYRRALLVAHSCTKTYVALVQRRKGCVLWLDNEGVIAEPVASVRQGVTSKGASRLQKFNRREAVTQYVLLEHYPQRDIFLVKITLHVGRRHQIRQHFASKNHPLVGDLRYDANASRDLINRAALHATAISIGTTYAQCGLPWDMREAIRCLKREGHRVLRRG